MSNHVVNPMLVEVMLEFTVGYTYTAPVVVRVIQIPFPAIDEDELAVPWAFVSMAVQLAIQSDLTVFQLLLLPSALKYYFQ